MVAEGGGTVTRGRKGKYETHIEPYLEKIKKMSESGATEAQMYKYLGVSKDTFIKYKKEKTEFSEALRRGRTEIVTDLKGALVKRALGFEIEEVKTVVSKGIDEEGNPVDLTKTTTTVKQVLPNVAALNLALHNYDPDWNTNPALLKLKERDIKLKEKAAKEKSWGD